MKRRVFLSATALTLSSGCLSLLAFDCQIQLWKTNFHTKNGIQLHSLLEKEPSSLLTVMKRIDSTRGSLVAQLNSG